MHIFFEMYALKCMRSDSYRRAQRNMRTNHFIERFRAAEQNEYSEKYREKILLGKVELVHKADLSVITIGRIEKGGNCRITTTMDNKGFIQFERF